MRFLPRLALTDEWPRRRLPWGLPGPGGNGDDDDSDDTIQTEDNDSNNDDDDDNYNGQDHGRGASAGIAPSVDMRRGTRTYSSEPHPRTRAARSSFRPELLSERVSVNMLAVPAVDFRSSKPDVSM